MNDLQRLILLYRTLDNAPEEELISTCRLASHIESLVTLIPDTQDDFQQSYYQLWDALEVAYVQHTELAIPFNESVKMDLIHFLDIFKVHVLHEINRRFSVCFRVMKN